MSTGSRSIATSRATASGSSASARDEKFWTRARDAPGTLATCALERDADAETRGQAEACRAICDARRGSRAAARAS